MPTTEDIIADVFVEDLRERIGAEGIGAFKQMDSDELSQFTTGGINLKSNVVDEVTVYDTATGEPRRFPQAYLKKTLQKMRGGRKAFIPADPESGRPMSAVPEYRLGGLMCFLHPDHPDRDDLATMGIGREIVCGDNMTSPAASFRSDFDLRNHEERRHPRSFKLRAEAQERRERQEQADRQDRQIAAMMAMAQNRESTAPWPVSAPTVYACDAEGCIRFFDTEQGLAVHRGRDHK